MVIATLDQETTQKIDALAAHADAWARSATSSQLERTLARVLVLATEINNRQTLVSLCWIEAAIKDEQLYRGIGARLFHLYAGSVYVESRYFRAFNDAVEYAEENYREGTVASQYAVSQIGSALPHVPLCSIAAGRYLRA